MQEKADDPNASHVVHGQVVPHYTFAKVTLYVIKLCIRDLSSAGMGPGGRGWGEGGCLLMLSHFPKYPMK